MGGKAFYQRKENISVRSSRHYSCYDLMFSRHCRYFYLKRARFQSHVHRCNILNNQSMTISGHFIMCLCTSFGRHVPNLNINHVNYRKNTSVNKSDGLTCYLNVYYESHAAADQNVMKQQQQQQLRRLIFVIRYFHKQFGSYFIYVRVHHFQRFRITRT